MKFISRKRPDSEDPIGESRQQTHAIDGSSAPGVLDISSPTKPSKKKWFVLGGAILVLGVGGIAAYILVRDDPKTAKQESGSVSPAVAPVAKSGPVFCIKVGINSLQCEELATKELRKYNLPTGFANISSISSSPNGDKFAVNAWKSSGNSSIETTTVYDKSLKAIATLPEPNKSNSSLTSYNAKWLDNNTLVYLTTGYETDGKTTIKTFDIPTSTVSSTVDLGVDIERIMPVGDTRHVYGIQAKIDSAKNSVIRNLAAIDLQTKQVVEIQNNVLNVDRQDPMYDQATSKFYVNALNEKEQKYDITIYKVDGLGDKPVLTRTGQINDVYAQAPRAYEVTTTAKGIFATKDSLIYGAPLKLYAENGDTTELSLAVGSYGNGIVLALPTFPDFTQAKTSDVTTNDLFQPASDVPKKVTTYVEGLAKEQADCPKGEYMSFVIQAYDQDKQFSLFKAGCGYSGGLAFYKSDGNSYKQFYSVREGISCEDRDLQGISTAVMPDSECRKPGEGL